LGVAETSIRIGRRAGDDGDVAGAAADGNNADVALDGRLGHVAWAARGAAITLPAIARAAVVENKGGGRCGHGANPLRCGARDRR